MASTDTNSAMTASSSGAVKDIDTRTVSSDITNSEHSTPSEAPSMMESFWIKIMQLWNTITEPFSRMLHPFRRPSDHTSHEDEENVMVYHCTAQISKKRLGVSYLLQFDLVDPVSSIHDKASDLFGNKIEIQLVSEDLDQETKGPKVSEPSFVAGWVTHLGDFDLVADYDHYNLHFKVPKDFGMVGAIIVKNNHPHEFFLQRVILRDHEGIRFTFNALAWVYPQHRYPKDRVFFSGKKYTPGETPEGLKELREQELEQNRGDGTGKRERWERIYDYDVYNDYGQPDKDITLKRPVLGGSKKYPFPRRNRTGRPMSKADNESESRLTFHLELPYIPSDEFFTRTKNSTFVAAYIKGLFHSVLPTIKSAFRERSSFRSLQEIESLYVKGVKNSKKSIFLPSKEIREADSKEGAIMYLHQIFAPKGDNTSVIIYPRPAIVKNDMNAWETDEEFGRQTLAGLNPSVIQAVRDYPPKSTLDPNEYGEGTALTDEHILPFLEGLSVAEAISQKKLYTIDYRDAMLELVALAIEDPKNNFRCYSPRVIMFFNEKGQMMPVAIELSLAPAKKGGNSINRVFTPADTENHTWGLAKIHFNAVDSNFHQVYSHFTETHAVIEPFIIATRRQLSALHPIFPLLIPHFKDTMNINAAARQILIAGGGQIEDNFNMGAQSLVSGSIAYGAFWRFDHLNPARRLVAKGMAEPADESYPGGVKLVIEDYPFAKDSLDLWDALYKWCWSYINIVYNGSDEAVRNDREIQAWWDEIRNKGHADKKDEPWWPKMDSIESLADTIASMGYIAGPYHAAVNFGQYAYGGFPLNKPTATRRFIPELNSAEYQELEKDPEAFLFSTVTSPSMATTAMTVLEMLATHDVDEEYLGTKSLSADYTANPKLVAAFDEFAEAISKVEHKIIQRNSDESLINRSGVAQVPYMLQFPSSTSGMTGQGVPYSTSV